MTTPQYNRPLSPQQEVRVRSIITDMTRELASFNGSFLERFSATADSDGATITMSIEPADFIGDLSMKFSDGRTPLITDPAATLVLTAGTDTVPIESFVYIPLSTKVLTESTSDWPDEEHIRVCFFVLQSAAKVQSDGPLATQNWNDHANGTGQGHLVEVSERLRTLGATWKDDCALTTTIVPQGAAPDNVTLALSTGRVWQLHLQDVASIDMAGVNDIHIVNHPTTAYFETDDLNTELLDSTGTTMVNKYFNLFIWHVASKEGTHQPLMCNLPDGSYSTLIGATQDTSGFDNQLVPAAFTNDSGTAWAIARLTFKHSNAAGGTWTLEHTVDMRGVRVNSVGGGTVVSTDHGVLDGLADDDHTQYHTDARALTWLRATPVLIDLSDVNSASAPISNDILKYNSGLSTWLHVPFAFQTMTDVSPSLAERYDSLSLSNGNLWTPTPGGLIQLKNTAGVTTVPGAFGAVPWDGSQTKVGQFTHDIATNNSEITCEKDGFIEIDVNLCFLYTSGGGGLLQAELQLNSGGWATLTGTARREQILGSAGGSAEITINWGMQVSVDDKIRVRVKKAGGVSSMPANEQSIRMKYLPMTTV